MQIYFVISLFFLERGGGWRIIIPKSFCMIQTYTLHTHTIGFDGRNTVSEMVNRAKELGFNTIGISNHFIVNPTIKLARMYTYSCIGGYNHIYNESFDEAMTKFVPHYEEIERVKSDNPDLRILRGLEVDFFPESDWIKGFEKCMNVLKPDYLIGSCHFIKYNGGLLNSHDWKAADADAQDILLKTYWANVVNAAQSGIFTWMAHLDLPKKVGLGTEPKWAEYEHKAVDAIRKSNVAMEINTSFYKYKNSNEPYPSNRILNMAHDIPVLISDDAHASDQIGRWFDLAENLITKYNLVRFQNVK